MSDLTEGSSSNKSSEQKEVWERAYRQGHPLWRGPSDIRLDSLKGKVLELGCGDGKTAISMIESGLEVVGLDISRTALMTLSQRNGSADLSLVQGDALDLPFKEGIFDSVTAVHFLDHFILSDRLKLIREIDRVLASGGMIIGRFFSTEDMRFGIGRTIEQNTFLRENGIFNHYFVEEEILDLFSGYNVTSISSSMRATKFSGNTKHRSFIDIELKKVNMTKPDN
jgi:ubiquinone/menaquinone biosynthesis C-methylase UbiE